MTRNMDMFSFLPDPLLLVIISLLPYKDAAKTSILSKRWLKTWRDTTRTNVNIDESLFVKPDESDESKEAQRRIFLNNITYWLSLKPNSFYGKFFLKVSDPESCREIIQRCVARATQRGVRVLSLDFSDPDWEEDTLDGHRALVQLPLHVYNLGSLLESLKLYSCSFSMPHILNFQSLKEISLGWINFCETTLRNLLRNCKTIEFLSLKKCGISSFDMGDTKLGGLKGLVIYKCTFGCDYFLFNAPNLEFFKFSGKVWKSHINIGRDVMQVADIDFPPAFEPSFDATYGDDLSTILSDFYPVRVLTVCSFLLQAIPLAEHKLCKLNVRHLILKTQMHPKELFGFTFVLKSCPWLEKLTLEISPRVIFRDYEPPVRINLETYWERPMMKTPKCLEKTLKVVEIKGCAGSLNEIKACRYLIGVGKVLEEMNIYVIKDEQEELRRGTMAKYLPSFPRATKSLDISIA